MSKSYKVYLAVVKRVPFKPPNVENATAIGMNQVAMVVKESLANKF